MGARIGNSVVCGGVTGTCNVFFGVNLGRIVQAHALPAVSQRERERESVSDGEMRVIDGDQRERVKKVKEESRERED
jgi:hypothetical protein